MDFEFDHETTSEPVAARSRARAALAGLAAAAALGLALLFIASAPSSGAVDGDDLEPLSVPLSIPYDSELSLVNGDKSPLGVYAYCQGDRGSLSQAIAPGDVLTYSSSQQFAHACSLYAPEVPDGYQLWVEGPLAHCYGGYWCDVEVIPGEDTPAVLTLVPLPNDDEPLSAAYLPSFRPDVTTPPALFEVDLAAQAAQYLSAPLDPSTFRLLVEPQEIVVKANDDNSLKVFIDEATRTVLEYYLFEICALDGTCAVGDGVVYINQPPDARDATWVVPKGVTEGYGSFLVVDRNRIFRGPVDYLTVTIVDAPKHGTFEHTNDFWAYAPNTPFNGIDTVRYRVCDAAGQCDEATITLLVGDQSEPDPTVTPEPDPTATPKPDPTVTPEPDPTVTPDPDPTATPKPDATVTPDPDPTETPEVTPEPDPGDPYAMCTILGTEGDDVLIGTPGDDVICGLGGNDIIKGKGGNDIIKGGAGDDQIKGGKGADVIEGNSGDDILKGGKKSDTVSGGKGDDIINGGKGADTLEGGSGSDTLNGGRGADILDGGKGNDVLKGNKGPDRLVGNDGVDDLDGGKGSDTEDEGGSYKKCAEVTADTCAAETFRDLARRVGTALGLR